MIAIYRGFCKANKSPIEKTPNCNSTTNQSAEIEAEVQVIGLNLGPPAMYPTKFIFDVYENGDLVQIFAKQLIDS